MYYDFRTKDTRTSVCGHGNIASTRKETPARKSGVSKNGEREARACVTGASSDCSVVLHNRSFRRFVVRVRVVSSLRFFTVLIL